MSKKENILLKLLDLILAGFFYCDSSIISPTVVEWVQSPIFWSAHVCEMGLPIPSLISTKLSSTNSILNSTYFEFGAKTSILRKLDAVKKNSKYRMNCRLIFVYTIHSSNNPPNYCQFIPTSNHDRSATGPSFTVNAPFFV